MVKGTTYEVKSELLAKWTGTKAGSNVLKAFYSYGDLKSESNSHSRFATYEIANYFAKHLAKAICNGVWFLITCIALVFTTFVSHESAKGRLIVFLVVSLLSFGLTIAFRKPLAGYIFAKASR